MSWNKLRERKRRHSEKSENWAIEDQPRWQSRTEKMASYGSPAGAVGCQLKKNPQSKHCLSSKCNLPSCSSLTSSSSQKIDDDSWSSKLGDQNNVQLKTVRRNLLEKVGATILISGKRRVTSSTVSGRWYPLRWAVLIFLHVSTKRFSACLFFVTNFLISIWLFRNPRWKADRNRLLPGQVQLSELTFSMSRQCQSWWLLLWLLFPLVSSFLFAG